MTPLGNAQGCERKRRRVRYVSDAAVAERQYLTLPEFLSGPQRTHKPAAHPPLVLLDRAVDRPEDKT